MAESMSVEAVLSAVDENLTKTLTQVGASLADLAEKSNQTNSTISSNGARTESLSGRLTTGFTQMASALGAVAIASKAFQILGDAISGAVTRYDTLKRYPNVMKGLGYATDDVTKSTKILDSGIKGLPTSLDSITGVAQQLAPLTGSAQKAAKSAVALNDAFLASGASAEDSSRGLLQYTQMLSTGKVDMMSYRTLMETMPIALRRVANAFGFTGKSAEQDLYKALQSGKITMDQLNDKFIELDGGMNGFAALAKANTVGIGTAFTNMKTAVVRGLANIITSLDSALAKNNLPTIEQMIVSVGNAIDHVLGGIADKIPAVIAAMAPFLKQMERFGPVIKVALAALMGMGVIAMLAPKIAPVIQVFGALGSAIGKVGGLAGKAVGGLGGLLAKLNPFSSAGKAAGEGMEATASGTSKLSSAAPAASTSASSLAKSIMSIGVGVGAAAAGMALLVGAVSMLAETGPAGAVAMAGVTASMAALIAVMTVAGKALGSIGPSATTAFASMALLVTAFTLLTIAVIAFASTGNQGIVSLAALTAAIVVITGVMAALSGVMTAGAKGLLAFGAAVLMVGAGIGIATAGMAMLLNAFNNFNASAQTVVATMTTIGQGFAMMFTTFITTLATQMPIIAQSIMQMLLQILTAFTNFMPQMVTQGALLVTNFLMGIAQNLPMIITAAVQVIVSFVEGIAANIGQVITAALDLIEAFVEGIGNAIPQIVSIAMQAVMEFVYGVGYALGSVIASGGKLIQMFIRGVMSGLSGSRNAGKSNANSAKSGISSVSLVSVGADLMRGFVRGIESMAGAVMSAAASIANAAKAKIQSALKIHSPSRVMRDEVGVYIPAGIAVGMLKNIGSVEQAADQVAEAAKVSLPDINTTSFTRSAANLQQQIAGNLQSTIGLGNNGRITGTMALQDSTIQMQNNALLRRIANKNGDIYLDGDTWVGATYDRYDERLGNKVDLQNRWS